jgi:hypothetical protein
VITFQAQLPCNCKTTRASYLACFRYNMLRAVSSRSAQLSFMVGTEWLAPVEVMKRAWKTLTRCRRDQMHSTKDQLVGAIATAHWQCWLQCVCEPAVTQQGGAEHNERRMRNV